VVIAFLDNFPLISSLASMLSQHHFFLVAVHLHFSRPQNATTVPVILVADSSVPSKVTGRGPLELSMVGSCLGSQHKKMINLYHTLRESKNKACGSGSPMQRFFHSFFYLGKGKL
jgi:hypothetical protein